MHKGREAHSHGQEHGRGNGETLRKLSAVLDHWVEHGDSHSESYRDWAKKASDSGEEEIAKEIYLAVEENKAVQNHLKRARDLLSAKMALRK